MSDSFTQNHSSQGIVRISEFSSSLIHVIWVTFSHKITLEIINGIRHYSRNRNERENLTEWYLNFLESDLITRITACRGLFTVFMRHMVCKTAPIEPNQVLTVLKVTRSLKYHKNEVTSSIFFFSTYKITISLHRHWKQNDQNRVKFQSSLEWFVHFDRIGVTVTF